MKSPKVSKTPDAPSEGKVILVVDDDYYFRQALENSLKREGHTVTCAENGKHAQELIGLQDFDVVISDIRMPEVDGLELLKWIKENKPIPLIMMTGFSELVETTDAAHLGASGFLSKPFKREELAQLIQDACRPAVKEQDDNLDPNFCKISIEDFVSGREMKFDIYVRISETKYIKVSHCGEDIEISRIRAYKKKGIHYLYMQKADFRKYLTFNLSLVKPVTTAQNIERKRKLNFLKHASEVVLQGLYVDEINRDDYLHANALVENSVALLGDNSDALGLLEALSQHTDFLYAHSVGVSFYAALIGKAMGWKSPTTVIKLSLGGLLHDVGKKEIPEDILRKPRPQMTPGECAIYESHPLRGLDILAQLQCIPADILQIVSEHHEDCLGFGYPNHLRKSKIQPMARVVALANDLCNLVIKNPTSPTGIPPVQAVQRLALGMGKYDDAAFRGLFRVFGLSQLEKEYLGDPNRRRAG